MGVPFVIAVLATMWRIYTCVSQNRTDIGQYRGYDTPSLEPPHACPVSACPSECAAVARVTECRDLFLRTGELNDQALEKFLPDRALRTKASGFYRQLEDAYVLDESKMSCDNVKTLLLSLTEANQDIVRNLVTMATGNITGNMDPVTILDSIPELFFNYIKLDMIIQNVQTVCCDEEQLACLCRMSFRLNCLNSLKVQQLTCNTSLLCDQPELVRCRRVKANERAVEKYCLKSVESRIPRENWGSEEWNRVLNSSFSSVLENKQLLRNVPTDLFLDGLLHRTCSSLHGVIKNIALHKVMEILKSAFFRELSSGGKQMFISLVTECGGSYRALRKHVTDKSMLLDTVDTTVLKSPRQMMEMRKTLKQIKPTLADYTKDDIVKYIRLFIDKKNQLQQLSNAALENALPEISHMDFNPSQLRKLYKKVSTIQRFSTLNTLVGDDVVALGNMLSVLPRQHLEEVPYSALGAAIAADSLYDLKWPKYMAKTVYSKFKQYVGKETSGNLTADELLQLGDIAIYLSPRDWRKISGNEILGFLNRTETIERVHRLSKHVGKAVENTIINKLRTVPGSDEVLLHYDDFRKAAGRMSSTDISDVATKLERGETVDVSLTKTQCKRTLAKMKEHLGPMNTWTTGNFETLKSSNLIGCISPKDLETAIKSNPNSLEIMSFVGASQRTNEKMKEKMAMAVKNQLENASVEAVSAMKDQLIENPQVLVRLKKDLLRKLECGDIISSLQGLDLSTVPCIRLRDKMDFYLQCKNITSNMDIDETVLEEAGSILCSMNASHISRMTAGALSNYSPDLAKCPCQSLASKDAKIKALKDKNVIPSSPDQYTEDHIAILSDDFLTMPVSYITSTSDEALEPLLSSLLENYATKEKEIAERKKIGFRNDRNARDEKEIRSRAKAFKQKAIQIILASRSSRRRRSADGLKCYEMQALQSALTELTNDQISAIDASEFSNCASLLGSDLGFSSSQIAALAAKAKEAWGSPSSWTEDDIYNAGRILQGLSTSELQSLSLDSNQIYNMGAYTEWDNAQKETLFASYLTVSGYNGPASINGSDLISLGHILCGMQTTEVALISPANYGDAAESIGDITTCSDEKLEAFASLAKNFFGSDITTWDDTTVSAVGIVIGGLDPVDIIKLTEIHIGAIDAGDIVHIPVKQFSSFTEGQLGYFSTAQAQAISMEQFEALSTAQKNIIEARAEMKFGTAKTVKSGSTKMNLTSWTFMVIVIMVVLQV